MDKLIEVMGELFGVIVFLVLLGILMTLNFWGWLVFGFFISAIIGYLNKMTKDLYGIWVGGFLFFGSFLVGLIAAPRYTNIWTGRTYTGDFPIEAIGGYILGGIMGLAAGVSTRYVRKRKKQK